MNDYSKTHCKYCLKELERDTITQPCNMGNVVNYMLYCDNCNVRSIWYVNQITHFKVCYVENLQTNKYYRTIH